jgi:hypothetical protein
LLAQWRILPLYSPKRHPQYNGGVERANGQLAGYQEAIAQFYHRPAGPTCDDAERARLLANDLAHPHGWQGPTAGQLWDERAPLSQHERAAFLASVEQGRAQARVHWNFDPDATLTHYQAAAVDRRAIRDALVEHDLLVIHPRRQRAAGMQASPSKTSRKNRDARVHARQSAGTICAAQRQSVAQQETAPSTVGGAWDPRRYLLALVHQLFRGGPFLRR